MGLIIDKVSGNPLLIDIKEADLDTALKAKVNQLDGSAIVNQGTITGNVDGDARGENSTDFQLERANSDEVAGYKRGFIAGGYGNKIQRIIERDSLPTEGHSEGKNNRVLEWQGHAEGQNCFVDGKISHVEGNTCICSANDSHAEGNRSVAGRRYFNTITSGSEDAGDGLGVLQYILINDSFGNVSAHFPNALIDSAYILSNYGAGAKKDVKGNVYSSAHTAALWTGDVPTTLNDLKWALHRICILRGSAETNIEYRTIAKCTYSAGTGTKVYYLDTKPYTTLIGIYGSYSPNILINGVASGNGHHAEGIYTQTFGYGSHAEGRETNSLNEYAHAEGFKTTASGSASHAEGNETIASGLSAHAQGYGTKASGNYSDANGYASTASGLYSSSHNRTTLASGENSFSINERTEATAKNSFVKGKESKALRENESAYSSGKRTNVGDDQIIEITYSRTVVGAGWWEIYILEACEDGKVYNFDTMLLAIQTAGSAGTVGNTFAYRFTGMVQRSGATYTVIGTPTRTLIGRSAGMSGDGLTTGERMSWTTPASDRIQLRFDSIENTTFRVQTYSRIQELSVL